MRPTFFKSPPPAMPDYERGKNQRTDDRFDQVQENVAEKENSIAPVGLEPAEQRANDQPNHDLGR